MESQAYPMLFSPIKVGTQEGRFMESQAYPMLFSPIKVGTQEVKNRVFMPPVSTNLADHGYVTDALVDHYTARAKGGVGLIITEVVTWASSSPRS